MPKMKFEKGARKQINLQIQDQLLDKIEKYMERFPYHTFSGVILQSIDEFIDYRLKYGDPGNRPKTSVMPRGENKQNTKISRLNAIKKTKTTETIPMNTPPIVEKGRESIANKIRNHKSRDTMPMGMIPRNKGRNGMWVIG